MTTNQKLATLIIIILLSVAGFGYYTDWTWKLEEKPPPEEGEWLGGTFDLSVAGRNSLDSGVSLTVGTDFTGDWWAYRSGSWVFLGSGSATGTEIESIAEDNGYVWLLYEEKSGKHYYADVPYTIAKNTYITDYKWFDADGDTNKEWLYKVSLWNIPPPASGYPSRTFYPYLLDESGDDTHADALKIDSPADQTPGTSTTIVYIDWDANCSATKMGIAIYKVMIEVNSTETTKWELEKVSIAGIGYVDGSLFDETVLTAKTQYIYKIGADFNDVMYWKIPSGTNNEIDCTVRVKTTLGSSDVFSFTLTIYQLYCDRTTGNDSDAVNLKGS